MPIQNVGTLLENIVLLEAARVLLLWTDGSGQPLDFANAFAMPPLSEWRNAEDFDYQKAFNSARLARLRQVSDAGVGMAYPAILRPLLIADATRGPNGALLVAILAARQGRRMRMWLNDLPDGLGHYPDTIAELCALPHKIGTILGHQNVPTLEVSVCEMRYDTCLVDLAATLAAWHGREPSCARLGFLDPNRYMTDGRMGPQTSPTDHRKWLRHLHEGLRGPAIAVHFSGNRDTNHARESIHSLHADGVAEGYPATRVFKRYHYIVSVNCFHPEGDQEANRMAEALEVLVREAWSNWHRLLATPVERMRQLITFDNGVRW